MPEGIFIASACLVGFNCRYDGSSSEERLIMRLFKKGVVVPLCPEQLGGLPTPRCASKILGGDGKDVINGLAYVRSICGTDVTENFLKGAYQVLKAAEMLKPIACIMKERSPSCGVEYTYTFSHDDPVEGMGVTSALLFEKGYKIISSQKLEFLDEVLKDVI